MDDLQILSCLIYDIQGQYARTEELGKARKDLEEMLFSVFHNIISDAPCTKGMFHPNTAYNTSIVCCMSDSLDQVL